METQVIEYKGIQKIKTGDKGFKELAKTCVSLANAQGGKIIIGFDNDTKMYISPQINRAVKNKSYFYNCYGKEEEFYIENQG